jgi:hypothetical protein
MSEDASVNTDAAGWPEPSAAHYAVRRMQTKLHSWAGADASRRFDDLFNLVYDRSFLGSPDGSVIGHIGPFGGILPWRVIGAVGVSLFPNLQAVALEGAGSGHGGPAVWGLTRHAVLWLPC